MKNIEKHKILHLHKNNSSNLTHCWQDFLYLLPEAFKLVYRFVKKFKLFELIVEFLLFLNVELKL